MLEKLDKIKWNKLTHAYGKAKDIPKLIQNLTSNKSEIRKKTQSKLYGNIFHQGNRYEATVFAIPFFFELLQAPEIPEKDWIIKYLLNLALGYPESYLPFGINIEEYLKELDYWKKKEGELSENDKYLMERLGYDIQCYKEVLKGVPIFIELLSSEDKNIRLNATFVLTWFREEAVKSIPKIRDVLKKEKDEMLIGNAILSLSLLDSYMDDESDIALFYVYYNETPLKFIKITAAIAIINVLRENTDSKIIEFLSKTLPNLASNQVKQNDKSTTFKATLGGIENAVDFPWNDGDIVGYVSQVLSTLGREYPKKVISYMCKTIKNLEGISALNLTKALLYIVFPKEPKGDLWTLEELNKFQLKVLKTLASCPKAWTLRNITFVSFSELMSSYKLPSRYKEMQKFLQLKSDTTIINND